MSHVLQVFSGLQSLDSKNVYSLVQYDHGLSRTQLGTGWSLQWGAADAEIKVSSGENTELKRCLLYTSDAADE